MCSNESAVGISVKTPLKNLVSYKPVALSSALETSNRVAGVKCPYGSKDVVQNGYPDDPK